MVSYVNISQMIFIPVQSLNEYVSYDWNLLCLLSIATFFCSAKQILYITWLYILTEDFQKSFLQGI